MIKQLTYINFFSDKAQEMVEFYVNQLGLTVKFTLKPSSQ